MTDYKEEQVNEIEALQSIYPDEITVLSCDPAHSFEVTVKSQCMVDDVENVTCVLQFTYTSRYPDEPPIMDVTCEEFDDRQLSVLQDFMQQQAQDSLGIVMVYTIVSAVQEKLTQLVEQKAQQQRDEKERLEREAEELERHKFEGTLLTIESFLKWKAKFDAEQAEIRRRKNKEEQGPKKLTGKELFMIDHSLDDSDVKFLEDGGEVVEVDESLFQDVDDLQLDDDDDAGFVLTADDDDS